MWQQTAFAILVPLLLGIVPDCARCAEAPTLKKLLEHKCDEQDKRLSDPCVAVKYFVAFHRGPELGPEFKITFKDGKELCLHMQHRMLVISWFLHGGTTALRYAVNGAGDVHDVREVHNWALQAWHDKKLGKKRLKELRTLLPRLPKSTSDPPIDRTVHVSFADSEGWRTETYDTENLPVEFESVMQILGERFETRDREKAKPN